ncbi:DUF115 domain-containing protein [Entomospira entomophila]|uniref:Motility associated factor glycosyltransferase family protein n=1 Tax=Entomospira entomophila TaxID=2719988 RepID=A0A968GAT8_9SPIO|nr:6-hydroxymethylpterin diphosphokinase MptE-like protein [Entomospira entomophilus]NIZ41107.1 motility associated factor glycosyltransferase family protein [Entomospira entomophilus]WDI35315.1 DUF115 domain-containing protein [Entomospira entomophilus]
MDLVVTKNHEYTVKIRTHWIHSTYNPTREAEKFIQNFLVHHYKEGQTIFILGSGLGYLEVVLNSLYPNIPFVSIDFITYPQNLGGEKLTFIYDENDPISIQKLRIDLQNQLSSVLTDENFSLYAIMIWPVARQIFPSAIGYIEEYVHRLKTSSLTLQHFSWRWLRNGFRNILWWNQQLILPRYRSVVVIAAGKTLEIALPFLINKQENYYFVVASSAVKTCRAYGLEPDLVVSIDGGYHAGVYMQDADGLEIINTFTGIAHENTSFLGFKNSFFDQLVSKEICVTPFSRWGGTVMSTAIELAQQIAIEEIILVGQDLTISDYMTHAKPHHLYDNILSYHDRYKTLYSQYYPIESHSRETLPMYAQWFRESQWRESSNIIIRRLLPSEVDLCIPEIPLEEFLRSDDRLGKVKEYQYLPEQSYKRSVLSHLIQQWESHLLEHPLSYFLLSEQMNELTLARKANDSTKVRLCTLAVTDILQQRIQILRDYLT